VKGRGQRGHRDESGYVGCGLAHRAEVGVLDHFVDGLRQDQHARHNNQSRLLVQRTGQFTSVLRSSTGPKQGAGSMDAQPALSISRPCSTWLMKPLRVSIAFSMVSLSSSLPKSYQREPRLSKMPGSGVRFDRGGTWSMIIAGSSFMTGSSSFRMAFTLAEQFAMSSGRVAPAPFETHSCAVPQMPPGVLHDQAFVCGVGRD